MTDARPDLRWLSLAIIVATVVVYAQTATHGFISLDDPAYVTNNPVVGDGLTVDGARWAFDNDSYSSNWHPLTWMSHMLDVELFGLERPGAHHLVSVAMHLAATLVLLVALTRMTGERWPSALVAALFALHPLHVESVAWAAERKDVLSGLFWMLTMLAYGEFVRRRSRVAYATSVVAFGLGLMSKPTLVTLPFALLLLDYWPLDRWREGPGGTVRFWLARIVEKIPFFALTAASCAVTLHAQRRAIAPDDGLGLAYRFANATVSYGKYLVNTVWPTGLAVFYPHSKKPGQDPITSIDIGLAVALLVVLTMVALYGARHGRRYLAVGWLWFLGVMVPMIGVVQVGAAAYADRYTYIPQIGLFAAFAWLLRDLAGDDRSRRRLVGIVGGTIVVLTAIVCFRQVSYWRDDATLFGHAVKVTENNALALTLYAAGLAENEQIEEATVELEKAVAIDPFEIDGRVLLGDLLIVEKRYAAAVRPLEEALRLQADQADARFFLAEALVGSGDIGRGIREARGALALGLEASLALQAQTMLAEELGKLGRTSEAVGHYEALLELDPLSTWALNNLAWLRATNRAVLDPRRAVAHALRATKITGEKDVNFLDTLAVAQAANGEFDAAVRTSLRALELLPQGAPERSGIEERMQLYRTGKPYRG